MAKNANGEGSIYTSQSRKGCFIAALVDPRGKRIYRQFKTRQEATEWMAVTKAEIYNGQYVQPKDTTVGEWFLDYLRIYCEPRLRQRSLERYRQSGAHLKPIADIPLQKLTALTVQKFYNDLPEMSGSSKLKIHTLLGAMFKKAAALDMVKKNIMLAVDRPKYVPAEIQIFTMEELNQLLDFLENDKYFSRYYPMIYFAATTGARLGEVLALKTKNVYPGYVNINETLYYKNGDFIIEPPKTKAGIRKITIMEEVENLLRPKGKVLSFDGYVFTSSTGSPFMPTNVEKTWQRILKKAGLKYRHFHALRHTHATQLLSIGVPILEVAKRLGHSKASHTLTLYGHAIPGYDASIPQKIRQLLSRANSR